MLYQTPYHYIATILEPQLGDHADQYDLEKVAYEMLIWTPGCTNYPAGWIEDSTERLADVLERNVISD